MGPKVRDSNAVTNIPHQTYFRVGEKNGYCKGVLLFACCLFVFAKSVLKSLR